MEADITPETNSVYFAYFEPYSHERHLDLIGSAAASEQVQVQHLGQTLDGRDMTLLRITDEAIAADGKAVARFLADLKNRPNIFVDAF